MNRARAAELRELRESTEDPVDRADQEMIMEVELGGTWRSPPDDRENREVWWQTLTSQIQLPDAAD